MRIRNLFTACLTFAALAGASLFPTQNAHAMSADSSGAITPRTFVDLAKKTLPSVVSIEVERKQELRRPAMRWQGPQGQMDPNEFFRRFFEQGPGQQWQFGPGPDENEEFAIRSAGTGFFIAVKGSTGYVMTNEHVVKNAKEGEISVTLGEMFNDKVISGDQVKVLERDSLGDLAVLSVELGEVQPPALEWGDSAALEVGEWVLALGNPLELRNSVSEGIVSAKHREINRFAIEDLLQTTASINPGNSGGPLVNLDGKVVGVNNAIATRTGMWQGVGFAIPAEYARRVADQVINGGRIRYGYLGIEMTDLKPEVQKYLGLENSDGVLITRVQEGSAAENAGIKVYDVITGVEGKPVKSGGDLLKEIATREVNSSVKLSLWRSMGGKKVEPKEKHLTATLGERPSEEDLQAMRSGMSQSQRSARKFGLFLAPREKDQANSPQGSYGLQTQEDSGESATGEAPEGMLLRGVAPGSAAARAGLQPGDIVIEVNCQPVKNLEQFNEALTRRPENRTGHLTLYLRRNLGGSWIRDVTVLETE